MAQLRSVELDDDPVLRDHNDDQLAELGPFATVNLFVGANNSGKSRIVRKLAALCQTRPVKFRHPPPAAANSSLRVAIKEAQGLVSQTGLQVLPSDLCPLPPTALRQQSLPTLLEQLDKGIAGAKKHLSEEKNQQRIGWYGGLSQRLSEIRRLYAAHSHCLEKHRAVYVPALRGLRVGESGEDTFGQLTREVYFGDGGPSPEVSSGQTLYAELQRMLLGRVELRDLVKAYEEMLSETFFGGTRVTLMPRLKGEDAPRANVVYVRLGGESERPIYDLGDGIQSLVALTFPTFQSEAPCHVFMEEPELFLHPGMQRRLMEHFLQTAGDKHQWFIATHSNHLLDLTIDYADIAVFRVTKSTKPVVPGTYGVRVTPVESGDGSVLRDLGVRASSVFLVNATVWVEGITDRLFLRHYLDLYRTHLAQHDSTVWKYREDVHYSFVEYGGANITHWSWLDQVSEHPTIAVERLCASAMVITDKDGLRFPERHAELQRVLGDRYLCLEVREIENLVAPDVLCSVVREWEGIDEELPVPEHSSYAESYLGKYIQNTLLRGREKTLKYYKDGTAGSISRKVVFMERVIAATSTYEELSQAAKDCVSRIWNFVRQMNSDVSV